MKKLLSTVALLLSFIFAPVLQAQFIINAELRTRAEANRGYISLPIENSTTAYYISQRTRLNLKYTKDKFTTYFSLQDVRLWGQEDLASKTGIQASSIGLDVSQAWFNWEFAKNWGLKTGRQIWDYDDGRILSGRNWNQTALSYDALLIHFDKDDFHFHFGSSINNTYISHDKSAFDATGNPYEVTLGHRIRYLNFVWLQFHVNENLSLSIADYMASYLKNDTTSKFYTLNTSGIHVDYHSKKWKTLANAYYQFGKNGFGKDISAYMLTFSTNYKTNKFNIGAGIDYLSGNDDTKGYQAFNLMYGARFKYYGWMNYYLTTANTKDGGLMDIYPNIKFIMNKKHSVCATYHMFWLAQQAYNIPVGEGADFSYLNRNLGSELDIAYKYVYDKSFHIQMHLGYYFATETLEFIKGVPKGESTSPIWASLMLTYRPEFFNTGD